MYVAIDQSTIFNRLGSQMSTMTRTPILELTRKMLNKSLMPKSLRLPYWR